MPDIKEIALEDIERYTAIVFIQGDEGRQLTDQLFDVEGVVAHGATQESISAMIEILQAYDNGDSPEYSTAEVPLTWTGDSKLWIEGPYVLEVHLGLGWVGLSGIVSHK